MRKEPRKQYFIEKKFQLRYAGIILVVTFLTAMASGVTVFYTTWDILGDKLAAVYPQGIFADTFNKVAVSLFRNMSLLAVFVFIFAILISHRIAGPVFRLKRVIRDIGEGKLDSLPVYLRKTDELHDLAEELNKIKEKLQKTMKA